MYLSRCVCLLALTAACAVGPDHLAPAAPSDQGYAAGEDKTTKAAKGEAQSFAIGESVAADWWRAFRCAALDEAIKAALQNNPGLAAARATLRQAQDTLRAGYGVFLPTVDLQAGMSRQHSNAAPGILPSNTYNLFTVSGAVSYSLDMWGGDRRQVEALGAGVDAQRAALAGTYVMLSANVVDALIARAAYRAEIDATTTVLAVLEEQATLAQAQAVGGVAPYANVLTLRSQIASSRATLPPLEQKVDQANHLLAALSGSTPEKWMKPIEVALDDFHLPTRMPVTLPSQLVRQRADVLLSEAQLHAANAKIGVATAAMLPNLTLGATYGSNSTTPGGLFGANSPFWSLGAGVVQPLLQEGALEYQRRAAIDARDAALALYRQTVLGAFEQVSDSLRALAHDAEALAAQTEAVATAERALALTQANYQAGIATYVQVLIADIQYLQTKIGYVEAQAARLQDSVALYVALGGGWWNDPAATRD